MSRQLSSAHCCLAGWLVRSRLVRQEVCRVEEGGRQEPRSETTNDRCGWGVGITREVVLRHFRVSDHTHLRQSGNWEVHNPSESPPRITFLRLGLGYHVVSSPSFSSISVRSFSLSDFLSIGP